MFALLFVGINAAAQSGSIIPIHSKLEDKIIDNYFKNTGGKDHWEKLQATKTEASMNASGMEVSMEYYQTKNGKQLYIIDFQGQKYTQSAFDGNVLWGTNPVGGETYKIEDASTIATMKNQMKNFPSPFLNYKKKGFKVQSMGTETRNGIEMYKLKLTQPPSIVDGVETANISYHYFDTKSYFLIISENGDAKEQLTTITMGDYKESDGLYFPFSISIAGQTLIIKKITPNPPINENMFSFPD